MRAAPAEAASVPETAVVAVEAEGGILQNEKE